MGITVNRDGIKEFHTFNGDHYKLVYVRIKKEKGEWAANNNTLMYALAITPYYIA